MTTNYTFAVSLFDTTANEGLQVWQSGTLALATDAPGPGSGVLTLPSYYREPIPFAESTAPPETMAGTIVDASGQSSEVEISLTVAYNEDGFLADGSYLAGLVSMLDYAAQETYLYVIQGFSPRDPLGTAVGTGPEAEDKRKPSA